LPPGGAARADTADVPAASFSPLRPPNAPPRFPAECLDTAGCFDTVGEQAFFSQIFRIFDTEAASAKLRTAPAVPPADGGFYSIFARNNPKKRKKCLPFRKLSVIFVSILHEKS